MLSNIGYIIKIGKLELGGVKMVKMAIKKLYLQWLQMNYVKRGSNKLRTETEKRVFRYLLIHPAKLTIDYRVDSNEKYAKNLNVLTTNVKNDKLYEITKKRLKSA